MLDSLWSFINTSSPLLYLTQPIWRDEAFSVLVALNPPLEILKISVADFGFPLFYLILHYWMRLFGYSEIAIRLLPFTFHLFTVYMVYKLSGHIARNFQFSRQRRTRLWRAIFNLSALISGPRGFQFTTTILTAVNPMLLYYAFEARTYSLLALLAVTSMYAFVTSQQRFWILVSTLGLYAHYYFALVILTQIIYVYLLNFQFSIFNFQFYWNLLKNNFYLLLPFVFFIPWTSVFLRQILASAETWRYPVDKDLWLAALGNLYIGYSGTPVTFSRSVQFISFAILLSSAVALIRTNKSSLLIFLWMIVPPLTILGFSFLLPLWVNRYLIFVAIAEIFLILLFIYCLPQKLQLSAKLAVLGLTIVFNIWFVQYQKKTDFRTPLMHIKQKLASTDLIAATDALILFETRYYLLDTPNQVKLYNPERKHIPNYIGTAIIEEGDIITELPRDRAVYLVNMDTSITKINSKSQIPNLKQIPNSNFPNSKRFGI